MLSLLLYGALALLLVLAFVWAWRSSKNIGSGSAQREAELLARMHSGKDPFSTPQEEAARKAKEAAQYNEAQGVESLFAGIPSEAVPMGRIDVADVTEAVDIERLLAGESLAVVTRARARLEEPTNLAMEGDTLPPRPAPPPPPPSPPLPLSAPASQAPAPVPVGDSWAARAAASAQQKKEEAARVFEQQRFSTERETADQIAEQRVVAERMAAERALAEKAAQQRALQWQAEQQEMERQALVRQEQERQEMQRQEWARQELERKQAEQRFEEQRIAAMQAEQALMAQRQAQLARQRALEAEKNKAPAPVPVPVSVGGEQSLDRNLPLRELTLAWFEARGYRSAPASSALRPIELVLRHKDDPARVYGFVVEDQHVEIERVKELREQAKSVGLMRMLIVANVGADPEAFEILRKKGVRVMDRAAVEQEFSELDFSIAAKIIAVARKRAALS